MYANDWLKNQSSDVDDVAIMWRSFTYRVRGKVRVRVSRDRIRVRVRVWVRVRGRARVRPYSYIGTQAIPAALIATE